jgi:hypothetical protein
MNTIKLTSLVLTLTALFLNTAQAAPSSVASSHSHVQKCYQDRLEDGTELDGQGWSAVFLVNYKEYLDQYPVKKPTCEVILNWACEHGSEVGFDGCFEMYMMQLKKNLSCKVKYNKQDGNQIVITQKIQFLDQNGKLNEKKVLLVEACKVAKKR